MTGTCWRRRLAGKQRRAAWRPRSSRHIDSGCSFIVNLPVNDLCLVMTSLCGMAAITAGLIITLWENPAAEHLGARAKKNVTFNMDAARTP